MALSFYILKIQKKPFEFVKKKFNCSNKLLRIKNVWKIQFLNEKGVGVLKNDFVVSKCSNLKCDFKKMYYNA